MTFINSISNNPLFSVLIANHNDGKYIEYAIDSILKQTYTNWEIIIVDDASTDDSKTIYKKYLNDTRFHIYYNDTQRGCGFTKRKCVEMSHGDICGFVDADDALTPNALELMVSKHAENGNASLIYSNYYYCDKDLKIINISYSQCSIPHDSSFLELGHGAISHFVTFKKSYYSKTEGISEYLKLAEDHDLYFKLEEVGPSVFIDIPLYYYRCNTNNNISLGDNIIKASYWDILAIYEACKRRSLSINEIVIPNFDELTQLIITETRSKTIDEMMNTNEFKLGSFIYKPIKKIRKILKKGLHHL